MVHQAEGRSLAIPAKLLDRSVYVQFTVSCEIGCLIVTRFPQDLQFVWESVEETPGPHPRPILQIVCLSVDLQFVWESVE